MFHRSRTERGQALVLIALAAVVLFAFAALAIDGSRAFSDKRHAQNTADTAVLAAALKYIRTTGSEDVKYTAAEDAAEALATTNGYSTGGDIIVDVDHCDDIIDKDGAGHEIPIPGDRDKDGNVLPCEGAPAPGDDGADEYIRVKIISTIPATFGRVLGRQTFTNAVEAIARVEGETANAIGDSINGAAMYATSDDASSGSACFTVNGGAHVQTHNSGVYVNCPKAKALAFGSGSGAQAEFILDETSPIPGCAVYNGQAENPGIDCYEGDALEIDEHTFDYAPTMPAIPSCSGLPTITHTSGTPYTPGRYSSIDVSTDSEIKPGLYCIEQDVSGSAKLTQVEAGTVTFVMLADNKKFSTGSSGDFQFKHLEVFTDGNNSDFEVKSSLYAKILRVFSAGGSDVIVSSGLLRSDDAYFYLAQGVWSVAAHADANLRAATAGPYKGLLVHVPWNNGSNVNINGGSNSYFQGTFLAPNSEISINGQAHYELHSQLIASTFNINGGANVDIYYVASENFPPPSGANPTIKLTK